MEFFFILYSIYIVNRYHYADVANADDLRLELVQVLFRHGARTCTRLEVSFAIPEHINQSLLDTFGYEQLTNIGKAQAHQLGCALRERYNDYLGPHYQPQDVYAYSSNTDRAKMSLQLVLAGLYPPAEHQSWHPELNWQPIPIHYPPTKELDILMQTIHSQKYHQALREAQNSSLFDTRMTELMKFNEFFKKHGVDAITKNGFDGCMGLFNVLNSHRLANATLPQWYSEEIFDKLKDHVIAYFDGMSLTTKLKKLNAGPLIEIVLDNINVQGDKQNSKKIYLYSGHEFNIAAFTRAHGIKEFRYPDFGNALVIEKLRDSNNQIYVRMLYYTGKESGFKPITLGNKEYCPIDEYLKIIKQVLPSDEAMHS